MQTQLTENDVLLDRSRFAGLVEPGHVELASIVLCPDSHIVAADHSKPNYMLFGGLLRAAPTNPLSVIALS